MRDFSVYILTNPKKTTLYIGMTNDLGTRLIEHYRQRGGSKTFAGRYFCYCLVYYESHDSASDAIAREKELKKWRREKKNNLVESFNPDWTFLNSEITHWPPNEGVVGRT